MKLLLFDIDGTLLDAFGAGREAVTQAIEDVTGRSVTTDGIVFSGKTDPPIVQTLLTQTGVPDEEIDTLMPRALEAYATTLKDTIAATNTEALPGVPALLHQLAERDDVLLGLLTGNLEHTAFLKLEAAGLDGFFSFGAFSSDNPDRNALPAVATQRAHAQTGHRFDDRNVVVIGDTKHDIACGKAAGARTVGVCTGRYSRLDLAPHGPDLLYDDLRDADDFIRCVIERHEAAGPG